MIIRYAEDTMGSRVHWEGFAIRLLFEHCFRNNGSNNDNSNNSNNNNDDNNNGNNNGNNNDT